jgi:uncharacterized Zn finger protein
MLEVQVEGSTGNHYVTTFIRTGNSLRALCTCAAGEMSSHCKHRVALLSGDLSKARGELPLDLAEQLTALLQGTEVERILKVLAEAQAAVVAAQNEVKRHRKALDRVMHQ